MVELSCPVTGCKYVVNGMNKEDVLERMARHRKDVHSRKDMAGMSTRSSGGAA